MENMRETNLNSEVNEKCPIVFVLQHEKMRVQSMSEITERRLRPKTKNK